MPFESFNPADPNYKKTKDLPEIVQGNFQDVPDGGFVRKEALSYQESTEYRAKMRSQDGQPVTGLEIAEEEARRLEAKIQQQTTEAINRLELSLGQPLSEEAKQEVYANNASRGHQSQAERQHLYDEQATFKNDQVAKLADTLSNLPEEDFQALSEDKKREFLASLTEFDRYTPNAEKPKALDAAAERLLRSYETSEALEAIHRQVHQAVLDAIETSEIISLAYGLEGYDEAKSLILFQKIADQFARAYHIEPIQVFIAKESLDDLEGAAFFTEDGKLGIVRSAILSSPYTLPESLGHEMAHAHQKKLTAAEVDSSVTTDTTRFVLDEKLERVYGREFYVKNYPFIAKEQDAKKAGLAFAESFQIASDIIHNRCDALLQEQGRPSLGILFNQNQIAKKAEGFLVDKNISSGEALIQQMLSDDPFLTEIDLAPLFQGKSAEECRQAILNSREQLKQALTLIGKMP